MGSKELLKENKKMKQHIKDQDRLIEMLSNKKVVKGLMSALEDVKRGDYIVLTNRYAFNPNPVTLFAPLFI